MSTLLGFLFLIVLIAWGVGLYRPATLRLVSRKQVSLYCGGALLVLALLTSVFVPATQAPTTPAPVASAPTSVGATTSAPIAAPVRNALNVVSAAPKQAAPVATVPSAPAQVPTTVLDVSGSGTKSTQSFAVSGNWNISYTYDCSGFGNQGNFQIYIKKEDGSFNDLVGANELGSGGSDTDYYHEAGTYYLEVNSECSWHVKVVG